MNTNTFNPIVKNEMYKAICNVYDHVYNTLVYNDDDGNFCFLTSEFEGNAMFNRVANWDNCKDYNSFAAYKSLSHEIYVGCMDGEFYQFNICDDSDETRKICWFFTDKNNLLLNHLTVYKLYEKHRKLFDSIEKDLYFELHNNDHPIILHGEELYDIVKFEECNGIDTLCDMIEKIADENSNEYKDFNDFLSSDKFTSIKNLYKLDNFIISVYDIMVFLHYITPNELKNGTSYKELKYKICYHVMKHEIRNDYPNCKGLSNFLIDNLYYINSIQEWSDIILEVVKETGKLPDYFYRANFKYNKGQYYIPLSYVIKMNVSLFKKIKLFRAVEDYYIFHHYVYNDPYGYNIANMLNINKVYDDQVKGYYQKVKEGVNKRIEKASQYMTLVSKLYHEIDTNLEAYMDALSVVLCNKDDCPDFTINHIDGEVIDKKSVIKIIDAYSNIYHNLPEAMLCNTGVESEFIYIFKFFISEFILVNPDKLSQILTPGLVKTYSPLIHNCSEYEKAFSVYDAGLIVMEEYNKRNNK